VVVPPAVRSTAPSAATAPSSRGAATVVVQTTKSRLVWPWYVLGVVLLVWIGLAIFLVQRRRTRLEAENREKERILAAAAVAEQQRTEQAYAAGDPNAPISFPGPPPVGETQGYLGYHPGEHGLLSGRDHPDQPGLMSGRGEQPPQAGGQQPDGQQPGGQRPAGDLPPGGPATPIRPNDPSGTGGPGTAAWRPDFENDEPPADEPPTDGRHGS